MRRLIGLVSVSVLVAACGGNEDATSLDEAPSAAGSAAAENEAKTEEHAPDLPDLSGFAADYETRDECSAAVPGELAVTYDIAPDVDGYDEVYEQAMASCRSLPAEPETPDLDFPERDGEVSGYCDTSLDSELSSGQEGRYKFLASIDAINTGDADFEVDVWVEFNQLGADPIRYTKAVEVAAGETETVHFDENITRNEWHRYLDASSECDIGGEITFDAAALTEMIAHMAREDSAICPYIDRIGTETFVSDVEFALGDLWEDDYTEAVEAATEEEC